MTLSAALAFVSPSTCRQIAHVALAVLLATGTAHARILTDPGDAALAGAAAEDFDGRPELYGSTSFPLALHGVVVTVSTAADAIGLYECFDPLNFAQDCHLASYGTTPVTLAFDPPVAAVGIRMLDEDYCGDVTVPCCAGAAAVTGSSGSDTIDPALPIDVRCTSKFIGAADLGSISEVVLSSAGYKTLWDDLVVVPGTPTSPGTASVDITKSADVDLVGHNQEVHYTLNAENAGPDPSTVTVVDFLPPHTTVAASQPAGSVDPDAGTVTWSLGSLAAGATRNLDLDVTAPPFDRFSCTDVLTNIALATSTADDPSFEDNVVVTMIPYDRASAAEREDCTELSNGLDEDCDGLFDCADDDCAQAQICRGPNLAQNPPDDPEPGPLPPTPTATCEGFNFFHEPVALPAICCGGRPCDACTDPSLAQWAARCPPADPNFKTSDPPVNSIILGPDGHLAGGYGFVRPGQTISYAVTYENVGGSDAHDVQVIDVLSPDLDDATLIVEGGGAYDPTTRTLRWVDPVVPPTTPRTVRFAIAVRADAPLGTRVRNVATVVFPDAFPPTRIDTNFVEHIIPDPRHLPIDLRVTGCLTAGDGLWQVLLEHRGYVPAYNVTARVGEAVVAFGHPTDPATLKVVPPRTTATSLAAAHIPDVTDAATCAALQWEVTYSTPGGERLAGTERCDNCLDDDGNSLVDYEDPACCGTPSAMRIARTRITRGKPGAGKGKLKLNATLAEADLGIDPSAHGLGLQLRDPDEELLCVHLAAGSWLRKGSKSRWRYRDRSGTLAGGIRSAKLSVTAKKTIKLKVAGKRMQLDAVVDPRLTTTVGSADACSSASVSAREKKRGLIIRGKR